jgi:hypothetical protein
VNGIANKIVASNDTRATSHLCSKDPRHANGGRAIAIRVPNARAKKSPRALTGLETVFDEITASSLPYSRYVAPPANPGRIATHLRASMAHVTVRHG